MPIVEFQVMIFCFSRDKDSTLQFYGVDSKTVCNINEICVPIVLGYKGLYQNSVKAKTCLVILRKMLSRVFMLSFWMIRLLRLLPIFWSFMAGAQAPKNNFMAGKTTGSMPSLEYGLGYDRLGGAKITFLDTNVVIKVVDSTMINYKVQLSKDHFAYLPKSNFKKDTPLKFSRII